MPVIAMTREMGSGGREVAQRVADRLNLTLVLHQMVEDCLDRKVSQHGAGELAQDVGQLLPVRQQRFVLGRPGVGGRVRLTAVG